MELANGWRTLASGNGGRFENGRLVEIDDSRPEDYEGPSCSICDALGHGYPGGPPCPLEDRGEPLDPREAWLESIDPQVNGEGWR